LRTKKLGHVEENFEKPHDICVEIKKEIATYRPKFVVLMLFGPLLDLGQTLATSNEENQPA
jgi:hypothetical protein